MKKKLFAFMLSYACIASSSYASLDLSNNLPHTHSIKWCLGDSPSELQQPFELMCGDAERLASLIEATRTQHSEPAACVAVDVDEDSSPRPPVLSQPTMAICDSEVCSEPATVSVAPTAPILTPELIAWAQDSIANSAKTVSDWIGAPRRRTFEAAAALLINKSRCAYSESVAVSATENNEIASDPIRHRLAIEDYRPYDFSFADNLQMTQLAMQSLACQAFANAFEEQQDIKAMQLAMAQSEQMCSTSNNEIVTVAPEAVVIKPLQLQTQASAYFIRQIPIDYHMESDEAALDTSNVELAEISAESDMSHIAQADLASVFGKSVLPVIDFNGIGFDVNIMSKSLALYRYSQLNNSSSFESIVAEQLPKASWIKDSIFENGNFAIRQTIAMGLNKLKLTLNQAQALVESLEVAISEGESVKVANKQMLNR